MSLGIEAHGYQSPSPAGHLPMHVILPRNSSYAACKTAVFTNPYDDMSSIELSLYEGEKPIARDNNLVSQWVLKGLTPGPRRTQDIELHTELDSNGVPILNAVEVLGGRKRTTLVAEQKPFYTKQQLIAMERSFRYRFGTDDSLPKEDGEERSPQRRRT